MTKVITYVTDNLLHKGHSNHLLPINDNPMLYYPFTVLMPIGGNRMSNIEMRHKN